HPSFHMPTAGSRIAHVLALIAAGHQDQILLSHDIAYKTALVKYGGYGYHHLLVNVVPRLRAKGVDDAGLRRLLVENPARVFAFAWPPGPPEGGDGRRAGPRGVGAGPRVGR